MCPVVSTNDLNGIKMEETEKSWEKPWSSDEIRKNSVNWTLAGDIGLLKHLQEFSHHLISRTHEMEKVVDGLVHQTKETCAKVDNVVNDFQMLSNLKFVENRVYDEEVVDNAVESKDNVQQKSKEEREADMLLRVKEALNLGLNVLDQAFEAIEVDESSDSEDEDISQGRTELKPKDMYEHRPLPFIIGTEAFQKDDYAGLKYMIEDESVIEESSAQDDDILSSSEDSETETDEDLDFDKETPAQHQYEPPSANEEPSTISITEARTKRLSEANVKRLSEASVKRLSEANIRKLSDSEGSDLFGEDDNASTSSVDEPIEEIKPRKPSIKEEAKSKGAFLEELGNKLKIPQKNNAPEKSTEDSNPPNEKVVPKKKTVITKKIEEENDDLFSSEDGLFNDNEESPFGKSDSLFTNFGKSSNKGEISDELFGKSKTSPVKKDSIPKVEKKTEKRDSLFDDDEDDEQDLFGSFSSKSSSIKSEPKRTVAPSKVTSTVQSSESITKSSKNVIKASTHITTARKESTISFSSKEKSDDFLFGSDSDDELFGSSKTTQSKKSFDFSSTNDSDGLFSSSISKNKQVSKPEEKGNVPDPMSNQKTPSLFDDKDDFDLFGSLSGSKTEVKESKNAPVLLPEKSDTSLFEDSTNLFAPIIPKEKKVPVKDAKESKKAPVLLPEKSDTSLFEESTDLFAPIIPKEKKAPIVDAKASNIKQEISVPEPSVSKAKTKDTTSDDAHQLQMENPMEPIMDILATQKNEEISFDKPIESTNTLMALNKDRAKIQVKRRKPTRKGRQTLQNLDNEQNEDKAEVKQENDTIFEKTKKSDVDDLFSSTKLSSGKAEVLASDDLFSSTNLTSEKESNSDDLFSSMKSSSEKDNTPKTSTSSHKKKELQKKDLMSQLISEAATSRIGKKRNSILDIPDDTEDDSLFSKTGVEPKLGSDFSFVSPTSLKPGDLFNNDILNKSENIFDSDSGLFSQKSETFQNNVQDNKSPFSLGDDDDDDIFKTSTKDVILQGSDDIFGGDSGDDIFASDDNKYDMFPKSKFEDDDDDDNIFGSTIKPTKPLTTAKENKSVAKSDTKKKPQDIFEDPLGGLSLND